MWHTEALLRFPVRKILLKISVIWRNGFFSSSKLVTKACKQVNRSLHAERNKNIEYDCIK